MVHVRHVQLDEPLEVQVQLKDAKAAVEAKPDTGDESKGFDVVVTTLAAATTSLFALLTSLGIASDRIPVLINAGGWSRTWLFIALACALAAAAVGMLAVVIKNVPDGRNWTSKHRKNLAAVFGAVLLFTSLAFAAIAASTDFTADGRPTITDIAVVADSAATATVTFTVHADGVSRNTLLRAFGSWVRTSAAQQQGIPLYTSTLRPDDKGVVAQKVALHVTRRAAEQPIRLQVYRDDSIVARVNDSTSPPVGASCANQGDSRTAAACAMVMVPAAVTPTASPTSATLTP